MTAEEYRRNASALQGRTNSKAYTEALWEAGQHVLAKMKLRLAMQAKDRVHEHDTADNNTKGAFSYGYKDVVIDAVPVITNNMVNNYNLTEHGDNVVMGITGDKNTEAFDKLDSTEQNSFYATEPEIAAYTEWMIESIKQITMNTLTGNDAATTTD